MVSNETDATTEDEQAIQSTDLDVLISLLWCESTTVSQEIDEAHGDATVNVEDELENQRHRQQTKHKIIIIRQHTVSFFSGGNLLDGKSIVQQAVAREVLDNVLLHELDTQIRVVDALDLVANTADWK
jgi:hypothetical protein